MRAFLSAVVAASLVVAPTVPLTAASATPVPPATTTDARAGAQVRGEALEGNWLWIASGVIVLLLLLFLLLDDDDEEAPVSP